MVRSAADDHLAGIRLPRRTHVSPHHDCRRERSPRLRSCVVPSYPSAWIGPTIIRETRSEPAPSRRLPSHDAPPRPPQSPTLRLVALLGSLKHLDAAGADLGLGEARLGISVGMMVGYAQTKTVRASGDFFGVPWDGPGYFTRSDDSKAGAFLDHPIMTVNEARPGPWEFEAGVADRRVGWMRLAVALFEDQSQDPNARQPNLPRGRRAAMREVLLRVTWADKGVATPSVAAASAEAAGGRRRDLFRQVAGHVRAKRP